MSTAEQAACVLTPPMKVFDLVLYTSPGLAGFRFSPCHERRVSAGFCKCGKGTGGFGRRFGFCIASLIEAGFVPAYLSSANSWVGHG